MISAKAWKVVEANAQEYMFCGQMCLPLLFSQMLSPTLSTLIATEAPSFTKESGMLAELGGFFIQRQ